MYFWHEDVLDIPKLNQRPDRPLWLSGGLFWEFILWRTLLRVHISILGLSYPVSGRFEWLKSTMFKCLAQVMLQPLDIPMILWFWRYLEVCPHRAAEWRCWWSPCPSPGDQNLRPWLSHWRYWAISGNICCKLSVSSHFGLPTHQLEEESNWKSSSEQVSTAFFFGQRNSWR